MAAAAHPACVPVGARVCAGAAERSSAERPSPARAAAPLAARPPRPERSHCSSGSRLAAGQAEAGRGPGRRNRGLGRGRGRGWQPRAWEAEGRGERGAGCAVRKVDRM